jgi:hypothetical protein
VLDRVSGSLPLLESPGIDEEQPDDSIAANRSRR